MARDIPVEMLETFEKHGALEALSGGDGVKAGIRAVIEYLADNHICPECFHYEGTGGEIIDCAMCGKSGRLP